MKSSLIWILLVALIVVAKAQCPPGYYGTNENCYPCPAGYYSAEFGAVDCTPCFPNTYSSLTAAVACAPCPPDNCAYAGSTFCFPC